MHSKDLLHKIIEYCFYALFILVPIAFTSNTSELFEFNKLWVTYFITIAITTTWAIRMVIAKKFIIQKTPLDIPIVLFLSSQILSTIFSLDFHTSLWGYYSRFNGGLFSLICYILLYYAFVSNLLPDIHTVIKRSLFVILGTSIFVSLWGLPAHFGYDPTCLLFRGSLDVSCWTESFQPKIRIFSTLGQPNWLAAYLAVSIPVAFAFFMQSFACYREKKNTKELYKIIFYLSCIVLFYVDIAYTQSRSGFLGLVVGMAVFFVLISTYLILQKKAWKKQIALYFGIPILLFLLCSFFVDTPVIPNISRVLPKQPTSPTASSPAKPIEPQKETPTVQGPALETGGSESGKIRLIVWQGALDIWKSSPLFGSGVETFAYAYYRHKPLAHNFTSEWDYLYNKAHNEYLNYLATTGILGLGSYVLITLWFFFLLLKHFIEKAEKKYRFLTTDFSTITLIAALLGGYFSIIVSNFFGFSVVILNIYLFIIPGFIIGLLSLIVPHTVINDHNKSLKKNGGEPLSPMQWGTIIILLIVALIKSILLIVFWYADTAYAYGANLNKAGEYVLATSYLKEAVDSRPDEPTFKDEYSYNLAVLATQKVTEKDMVTAQQYITEAIRLSDDVVTNHPNVITFLKTRVRVFYTLGQIDPRYLSVALQTIIKASEIAPTDAKVAYTMGVIYGQTGDVKKGKEILQYALKLKPGYKDAEYALSLFEEELKKQ